MFKNINFFILCIGIIITISFSGIDFITYRIEKDLYSCYSVKIAEKSINLHNDIGEFKCNINNKMYNGSVKCNVWEEVGDNITVATSAGNIYIRTCFLLTRTVCFMIFIDILIFIKWVVRYYFGLSLDKPKQLKTINYIGDVGAIIGVLMTATYILLDLMISKDNFIKILYSKPIQLLLIICFQILCIIKIIKAIFDYRKNKNMMAKSYIYIPANEMIINALPKNQAVYTIKGNYSINGITYQYSCKIVDDFHLITDYMISIKEKGNLPDMKVYVDTSHYEQYYISPYEYLEKIFN